MMSPINAACTYVLPMYDLAILMGRSGVVVYESLKSVNVLSACKHANTIKNGSEQVQFMMGIHTRSKLFVF